MQTIHERLDQIERRQRDQIQRLDAGIAALGRALRRDHTLLSESRKVVAILIGVLLDSGEITIDEACSMLRNMGKSGTARSMAHARGVVAPATGAKECDDGHACVNGARADHAINDAATIDR